MNTRAPNLIQWSMYCNKENGKMCLDALLFFLRHYSHSPQRDAFSMVTLVVTLCLAVLRPLRPLEYIS